MMTLMESLEYSLSSDEDEDELRANFLSMNLILYEFSFIIHIFKIINVQNRESLEI